MQQDIRETISTLKNNPELLGLTKPQRKQYPSVSAVLRDTSDHSGLEAWRARVGNEEADRITRAAAARGTAMHTIIERHFGVECVDEEQNEPDVEDLGKRLYSTLKPFLSKIDPIELELPLWSDRLGVNGRLDCIGYYNGELSIIDFKSSLKEKNECWITDYFLQTTLYSMMLHDLTGIPVRQIIVLIAVERGFPQLFRKETKLFLPEALRRVRQYQNQIRTQIQENREAS
jgi:ATP-dependent exoDNAse (exonuclease V) beta subunit